MPGNLTGRDLERFVRDATSSYWHQTGTAKQQGAAAGDFRVVDVDTVVQCMHAAMSQAPQWCAGLSDRAQRKAVVNLTDTLMMLTGPR